jgi:DNA-binding NarL/FixJ family response regulator
MQGEGVSQIRIVLVDDDAIVRAGLRMLIERGQGFAVVGEAGDRDEAVAVVAREQPDIILLELYLGGHSSLEFFTELASASQGARVLVLTAVNDPEIHRRAVLLGSAGVVLKRQASEALLRAIERVCQGEVWLDQATIAGLLSATNNARGEDATRIATLTKREREIILLIGEGLRNRQIADRLFISETTVRHHLTSIFSKLGVSSRLDLVVYAYRHGIAKSPAA